MDSSDIQHEKLSLKLVSPDIPGYSVPPDTSDKESSGTKRSSDDDDAEKTPNKKPKKQ